MLEGAAGAVAQHPRGAGLSGPAAGMLNPYPEGPKYPNMGASMPPVLGTVIVSMIWGIYFIFGHLDP